MSCKDAAHKRKEYPKVCANCKWGVEANFFEGDYMAIECHRFPPMPNPQALFGIWPKTEPDATCGEFAIMRKPRIFEWADGGALANAAAPAA